MSAGSAASPTAIRWATYALAAYSAVVIVYPAILLAANGWQGGGEYFRSLMRAAVVWILIRHLRRGDRWAWWLGVSFTASWIVLGLLGVLAPGASEAGLRMPQGFALVAALSIVLLTVALTLLLLPDSRRACRVETGAAP